MSTAEPRSATKSGTGQIILGADHFHTQASGVRIPANQQSGSPNSRIVANIQSNASAGVTGGQQTFYMADRLKKTGGGAFLKNQTHIRHGSVDDHHQVIASTNDSRVEDMLPTVSQISQGKRQTTKSVNMRQTMYNNSYFQKLINNVQ